MKLICPCCQKAFPISKETDQEDSAYILKWQGEVVLHIDPQEGATETELQQALDRSQHTCMGCVASRH